MYTKQMHEALKAKVQALLDQLLKTAEANSLEAGEDLMLIADDGIVRMEIGHTVPFGTMRFFVLRWKVQPEKPDFLNLEYHTNTRTVDDSAKFNDKGEYLGNGHIQCWHSHDRTLEEAQSFLDWLQALVLRLDGKWKLVEGQEMMEV